MGRDGRRSSQEMGVVCREKSGGAPRKHCRHRQHVRGAADTYALLNATNAVYTVYGEIWTAMGGKTGHQLLETRGHGPAREGSPDSIPRKSPHGRPGGEAFGVWLNKSISLLLRPTSQGLILGSPGEGGEEKVGGSRLSVQDELRRRFGLDEWESPKEGSLSASRSREAVHTY
jgi:hypothetical protein